MLSLVVGLFGLGKGVVQADDFATNATNVGVKLLHEHDDSEYNELYFNDWRQLQRGRGEYWYDVDANYLVPGNKIFVMKEVVDTNAKSSGLDDTWASWGLWDSTNDSAHDPVLDKTGKLIGHTSSYQKGNQRYYYLQVENRPGVSASVGIQNLHVKSGNVFGMNYQTPPPKFFAVNYQTVHGELKLVDGKNNSIKNYKITMEPPKIGYGSMRLGGGSIEGAGNNGHASGWTSPYSNWADAYYQIVHNDGPYSADDRNHILVNPNNSTNNYQFAQEMILTMNSFPGFDVAVPGIDNVEATDSNNIHLRKKGDTATIGYRLRVQLMSPDNHFVDEDIDYNVPWVDEEFKQTEYHGNKTHMTVTRVDDKLSAQQMKAMLDREPNKTQALTSEQANGHWITVYNVTRDWMRHEYDLVFKWFEKTASSKSFYWNSLNSSQKAQSLQNMKNFVHNQLNGSWRLDIWGGGVNFKYPQVVKHVHERDWTLNTSFPFAFDRTEDYDTNASVNMHDGQSGIFIYKINGKTGEALSVSADSVVGNHGSTTQINLKDYQTENIEGQNYVVARDLSKVKLPHNANPNDVLTKDSNQVTYPSQSGHWKQVYIVYVPLEVPTKSASNSKHSELNENTNIFPGSKLTYHINQPISATYDSVELKDALDKNLSFDKAGSSLSIGGSKYSLDDKNVVSSLTYAGNTVDVSINKNFLAKKDLIGQTLTLNLAVKVSEDKRDGAIKNTATSIVNGFEQKTNEVTIPVTPPPTIPSVKAVNKTEGLKYGDKLTYTITQKVHTLDENIGEKYKSFALKDAIPSDLHIDNVKFLDNQNHDLTNSAGNLSTTNNNVIYSLTSSFLSAMPMQGETYTLKIDTTYLPRHQVHVNDQLTNKAVTLQDKNNIDSNTVTTKVKPTDPVIKKTTTYTGIMDSTKDNRVHYQIKANYGDAHDTTGVGIYDVIPQNGTLDTNSIKVTGNLSQSSFINHSNDKVLDLKPTTNAYNTNTTIDFDVVYAKDSDWSDFAKYMINPTGQISDKSYMQVPNVGELRFTDGFKLTDIAKVNVGVQMPKISEKVTQNNQALTDFLKNGKYSDNNYNGPIKYVITVTPGNYQKLNSVKVLSDINHNWLDFDSYLTKYGQANISSNNDTHTADFSNPQSLSGKTFDLEITGKALIKYWQHYSRLDDMVIGHSSVMQINGQNYQSNATKVQLPNIIFHNGLATKGYIKGNKMYVEHYVAFRGRAINKNDTSTKLNGSMFNGKNNDDFGVYTTGNNFKLNGTLPQNIALNERVIYKYTFVFDKAYILNNHNFEINEDANLKKMLTTDNKPVFLNTLKDSNLIGGTTLGLTNADSAKINQNFRNHTLTKDNRKQKNLWGFIKYYGLPYNDYRQYTENYTRVISEDYQLDGYDNAKVKGGYGAKLDHKLYALNYQTPDYVNDYKLGFKSLDKAFDDVNIDSNRTEFLAFDKKQPLTDAKQINNKLAEIKNGGSFEEYTGIKGMTDSEKQIMQTRENELHLMPQAQLDEISYKFNKRVLDNGHQAYDLRNTVYNENNNKNAVSNSIDGGNRNYLKDFLRNNQYRAKLTSANHFGAGNNINIDFDIMYNVYGHRYLGKAGNADNSTYDEIAIQPVISGNKAQHVEGFSQSENEWLQNNQ